MIHMQHIYAYRFAERCCLMESMMTTNRLQACNLQHQQRTVFLICCVDGLNSTAFPTIDIVRFNLRSIELPIEPMLHSQLTWSCCEKEL